MGMIGNYYRIDDATLEKIKNGTLEVSEVLYGEDAPEERFLDIDKSWHMIHFTLTKQSFEVEPTEDEQIMLLSKLVLGGTPIDEEDVGYGPALLIEKDEVQALSEQIGVMTEAALKERFDFAGLVENKIYPVGPEEDEEDLFDYLWSNFQAIQEFFKEAAKENTCVLTYVN